MQRTTIRRSPQSTPRNSTTKSRSTRNFANPSA
jgi:hypothetical protein